MSNFLPRTRDYQQQRWSPEIEHDLRLLVRLAVSEDLDRGHDWTTVSLAPEQARGAATIVSRQAGVAAGIAAAPVILHEMDADVRFQPLVADGDPLAPGQPLGRLSGSARDLLTTERIVLNVLGRLCGVATMTRAYVDAVAGAGARVYDTRKTTCGWRRLEKFAVQCGGGRNHRLGLFDAVLIKDNHLALGAQRQAGEAAEPGSTARYSPAEAVLQARRFLAEHFAGQPESGMIVEVEVDSLAQLQQVLTADPDLILLDNMPPALLRQAVAIRNASGKPIELEASGGITLSTIRAVAETGVERISCGALTHSAIALDIGLDWSA